MKTISIVGYGRFGQTLYRLLKDDFSIMVYNRSQIDKQYLAENTKIAKNVAEIYESEAIFYCVPISTFEETISSHKQYFRKEHVLIDMLSVKYYPKQIFEKYLKDIATQALLTHPMFGPDSSEKGFDRLPIILDKFKTTEETYQFWKNYFIQKKLHVIEMSAKEHDRFAADSQGLTHFIGRVLAEVNMQATPIDSLGTKKLLEVKEQTCNDTWELFTDLQQYNPFTKYMRIRLGEAYDKIYNNLLPKHVDPDVLTIGIQGGQGSFNEEAVRYFLKKNHITDDKIKYLYTSNRVLQALHEGEIDQGLFAIHNSAGGIVEESIKSMAHYKFTILEEFAIKISHALMVRKDVNLSEVTTIMTHPQVLAQCRNTLKQKYPYLKQISGEGKLIDHALVAQQLKEGKLPKNIGTMGSKILAQLYDLQIVEENLQDLQENYTSFLMVKRFE